MTTQTNGATAPTPCNDLRRLQDAITDMDCQAQNGFSEISAIAKLALAAMETPDGYCHPENLAKALLAIWGKADDAENSINYTAESVGCNYQDSRTARRYAAHRAFLENNNAEEVGAA